MRAAPSSFPSRSFADALALFAIAAVSLAFLATPAWGQAGWRPFMSFESHLPFAVPGFTVSFPPTFRLSGDLVVRWEDWIPARLTVAEGPGPAGTGNFRLEALFDELDASEMRELGAADPGICWNLASSGSASGPGGKSCGAGTPGHGGLPGVVLDFTDITRREGASPGEEVLVERTIVKGSSRIRLSCVSVGGAGETNGRSGMLHDAAVNGICLPFLNSMEFM
ncbi:MAG: hypothetical protein LBT40_15515 [Deltaproteobacteria bacterium]|jgi:hypothetical protein|nr:hypothetical protein [Deltaproteobacteria bacterium]